jgi:transcriptional regulator EpsA
MRNANAITSLTEPAEQLPALASRDQGDLLDTIVDGLKVKRRYQFFVWAQSRLQLLLPHAVLVCGLPRSHGARMFFDYFYSVPIEADALSALCHPREGLAVDLLDQWVVDGCEPMVIGRRAGSGSAELMQRLEKHGFGECLVHGIPGTQGAPGAHCMVAFISLATTPGERELAIAQLLVPHVFGTYCRALTRERPGPGPAEALAADQIITDREIEILRWIRDGKSNQEIGMILDISPLTVKNHVQKILRKLNASNRAQAVSMAIDRKLLTTFGRRAAAASAAEAGDAPAEH